MSDYDQLFEEAGRKYNVDPALLKAVAKQESNFNPKAVSPAGAQGLMQLLPRTAKTLGVDPLKPEEAVDGAARLLSESLDRNGNVGDAVAEYHGGTDRRLWGPKTRKYQQDVLAKYQGAAPDTSGMSDDAILSLASGSSSSSPQPSGAQGDLSDEAILKMAAGNAPATATLTKGTPAKAPATPRSAPADVALGAVSGVRKGGATLADTILQASPLAPVTSALQMAAGLPGLLGGAPSTPAPPLAPNATRAAQAGYTPQTAGGRVAETIGALLPNVAIPGSAAQRIAGVLLPAAGQEAGRGLAKSAGAGEEGQHTAGLIGSVLGGAASGLGITSAPKLPKADLAALAAEKQRLYGLVDKSGFVFPKADMQSLAADLQKTIRDFAGPKGAQSVPAADAAIAHLKELASQKGGVTLPQLDLFRSNLYDQLISKGGAEAKMGYSIRKAIDGLMDESGAPGIKAAREANTRWEKVREITDRIKSAELAAARANSGENVINAIRQKLSPLVDPLHGAEIKNLTPEERAVLEGIVTGTPLSNTLRNTSKMLRNKFVSGPLSAGASVVGGLPVGAGVMGTMEALGQGLRKAGENVTKSEVQKLMDLMAAGGKRPPAPPPRTMGYAGVPAITAPILLGTPATAAPRQSKKQPQR